MSKNSEKPKILWIKKAAAEKVEARIEEAKRLPVATPEPQVIDSKTFRKLTDAALDAAAVSRNELFEYPYNEFESRKLIAKAEKTVRKMAKILGLEIES